MLTKAASSKKTQSPTQAKKLLTVYNAESPHFKQILQIIALLCFIEHRPVLLMMLDRLRLKSSDKREISYNQLKLIMGLLKTKKLLTDEWGCDPDILHHVAADAVSEHNPEAKNILLMLERCFNYHQKYDFYHEDGLDNIRLIHVHTHLNNTHIFLNESMGKPAHCNLLIHNLMNIFYLSPLDMEWVKSRHPVIQLYLLCTKLMAFHANVNLYPPDLEEWVCFIRENDCVDLAIKNDLTKIPLLMSHILQLSICFKGPSHAREYLHAFTEKQYYQHEIQGVLAFFKEDRINAIKHYEKAQKLFRTQHDRRYWTKHNIHALFYVLALLYPDHSTEDLKKAETIAEQIKKLSSNETIPSVLKAFIALKESNFKKAESEYNKVLSQIDRSPTVFPFLNALIDWISILLDPEKLSQSTKDYRERLQYCQNFLHSFTAQFYAELLQCNNQKDPKAQHFLEVLQPLDTFRWMKIMQMKQPWEYTIAQLHHMITGSNATEQQAMAQEQRVIWLVDPETQKIELAEQTQLKNGKWSIPKPIAHKRLYDLDPKFDYLTSDDRAIINAGLERELSGWFHTDEIYIWNAQKTLNALIGHSHIFHYANHEIPLELVKGTLELQVEKKENGYHFSLSQFSTVPRVFLEKETTNRYRVIDFSEEAVSIANILSAKGMTIPFQAKDQVIEIICNAKSTIHIQSDIADDQLPTIGGDATPHIHLFPMDAGIKINLWIKPFGEQGPYCRAAQGQRNMIAAIQTPEGETKHKIIRDFDQERNNMQMLIQQCATLNECNEHTDEWHFDTVKDSLETLTELDEYRQSHPLIIEWPKGQTLKIKRTVSSKNLSLSIRGSQYWFEYEGQVNIDEGQVLDIKKLMDLLDHSQGRFVPLASGEFLALTEKFKKQLEELRALSNDNKVYHLSTSSLQGLAKEAGVVQEDDAWSKHLKKLTAMEKYQPSVPSTLQAELRDYQVEGFSYLSRLAHWEIGACLADDMGLGKTLQAITLLLTHASQGPCLVVAPTSVCFVWLEELAKFAPTLVPHTLYNAADRKNIMDSLGRMDILICSYGLLPQVGDLLIDKTWQMIVLDEAQAIKNPETKRWKYATQLKSSRRIALTGTPIENHLGELWSIFRFLNPGLLGNLAFFQQRFSGPIEKYQDPIAKRTLKNIVSPYILRRTKSEVLTELPPKIEQSILIEPTSEEQSFYEAVRVKALEKITQLNQTESNTKRFNILAEISRLRQACCHSSLVDENMEIPSSKVKTFLTLVKNIIDNNHKALIFSQFVRYLDKIKEVLDQEKMTYQYLDGATPIKERKRAVDAFQSGEGDLFLISLKAGGTGLNLTAADYVIILDPWWNPAIEDQAADRAHRMGQVRPVTVYRLIMKNSIEEKIITLHKSKKDLAADLLSGSDMTGKISEEELLGLMTS